MPAQVTASTVGPINEARILAELSIMFAPTLSRAYIKERGPSARKDMAALMTVLGFTDTNGTFTQHVTYHTEASAWRPVAHIAAVAQPAYGANITVTLVDSYGVGNSSAARAGNVWKIGSQNGVCVSVNTATAGAHTMTLRPLDGPWGAFPAGTPILRLRSANGENDSSVIHDMPRRSFRLYEHIDQLSYWGLMHYTNFASMVGKLWFHEYTDESQRAPWAPVGSKGVWGDAEYGVKVDEILTEIAVTNFFGSRDYNTVRTAGGSSLTDGMWTVVKAEGNNFVAPGPTGYNDQDFHDMAGAFLANQDGGSSEKTILAGRDLRLDIVRGVNAAASAARFVQSDDKKYNNSWNSVDIAGAMFSFGSVQQFDQPEFLGAFGMNKQGIILPDASDTLEDSMGKRVPRVQCLYFSAENSLAPGRAGGYPFHVSEVKGHSWVPNGGTTTGTVDTDEYIAKMSMHNKNIFMGLNGFATIS